MSSCHVPTSFQPPAFPKDVARSRHAACTRRPTSPTLSGAFTADFGTIDPKVPSWNHCRTPVLSVGFRHQRRRFESFRGRNVGAPRVRASGVVEASRTAPSDDGQTGNWTESSTARNAARSVGEVAAFTAGSRHKSSRMVTGVSARCAFRRPPEAASRIARYRWRNVRRFLVECACSTRMQW